MQKIGEVVRVIENGKVEMMVKRAAGCGNCSGCSGSCSESSGHKVIIENTLNVKTGDIVELKAVPKNVIKYVSIVYLVPFFFLINGIVLGSIIFNSFVDTTKELLSFALGMIFLGISYFVIRLIDKRFAEKGDKVIEMEKVLLKTKNYC